MQHREGALRERGEELVEEPAKLSSGRRSQASAPRSAPPSPTATNATAHPFVVVSEPRQTASTADPGEHQHHDRHPGDQAHPVDRGAHAEPARREPARHDQQQRRGSRARAGCAAEVRERAGVVGQLRLLGLRRRLGLLRRRRAAACTDVGPVAPCRRRTNRSTPTRRAPIGSARSPWPASSSCLTLLVGAVLHAVAESLHVVLPDQEHDRRLGELLEPRHEVRRLLLIALQTHPGRSGQNASQKCCRAMSS